MAKSRTQLATANHQLSTGPSGWQSIQDEVSRDKRRRNADLVRSHEGSRFPPEASGLRSEKHHLNDVFKKKAAPQGVIVACPGRQPGQGFRPVMILKAQPATRTGQTTAANPHADRQTRAPDVCGHQRN